MCSTPKATGLSTCETNEFSLPVPVDLVKNTVGVSSDIGGSLMKFVFRTKENFEEANDTNSDIGHLQFVSFPRAQLHQALDYVAQRCVLSPMENCAMPRIYSTGLGSSEFGKLISEKLNVDMKSITEHNCFITSFTYLAAHLPRKDLLHPYNDEVTVEPIAMAKDYVTLVEGLNYTDISEHIKNVPIELDISERLFKIDNESERPLAEAEDIYPCLLVICGSAIVYIIINEDKTFEIIDIVWRGGRSFYGLGTILTGCKTYQELIDLAAQGNQRNVDVFTDELFATNENVTSGDESFYLNVTESNNPYLIFCFGKGVGAEPKDFRRDDLARAWLNYFVIDIAQTMFHLSRMIKFKRQFLCGGFCNSQYVRNVLATELVRKNLTATYLDSKPVPFDFIKPCSHLGALGALIYAVTHSSDFSDDKAFVK